MGYRWQLATTARAKLNAGGKDGTGGRRTALGEGPEPQAAAHLASGALGGGQIKGLGLGPGCG